MPKNLPSNAASVAANEARKEVRRRDDALREYVGTAPVEQDVIDAFPEFFPGSHMTERDIRRYAKSVIARRPHFV